MLKKAHIITAGLHGFGRLARWIVLSKYSDFAERGAAWLLAIFLASPAGAQAAPLLCLPPEAPMTALPSDVVTEYRAEIAVEFEAYFGAVTDYIACLDDERARFLNEARAATEAYSTLLSSIPAVRNAP